MSWGLVAVAGATLVSGAMGSSAAGKAARASSSGEALGIKESRRQFDLTQESFRPFQEAGVSAIGEQQALLGLSGVDAEQQAST